MSKKDYVLIAAAIREELLEASSAEVQMAHAIASRIADAMKSDNFRFDKARFMQACGFKV